MTDEERAYLSGQCNAYGNVFKAFTKAFADGHDIHWLHERIAAQFNGVLATLAVQEAL
jgi:hypothetical protein